MIPSVCLFKNLHEITSNIKTKTKHVFDRSFSSYLFLVQVGGFRSTVQTVFLIAFRLKSLNRFTALSKNQHLHQLRPTPNLT